MLYDNVVGATAQLGLVGVGAFGCSISSYTREYLCDHDRFMIQSKYEKRN